jgi:hypothetical protein
MIRYVPRCQRLLVILAAQTFLGTTSAQAITLSVGSFADNTTYAFSGQVGQREGNSNLAFPLTGGTAPNALNSWQRAIMRYTAVTAADNGPSSSADIATGTHNYTATFTTSAQLGVIYRIDFKMDFFGAVTVTDGRGASASMGPLSGSLNGFTLPQLSFNYTASVDNSFTTTSETQNFDIFYWDNLYSIGGLQGTQTHTVHFDWTSTARSTHSFGPEDPGEAAGRFGIAATLDNMLAGDYPGLGNRNIDNDGHWLYVTMVVTQAPEPTTLVLGIMAGVGLLAVAIRHRHRSG